MADMSLFCLYLLIGDGHWLIFAASEDTAELCLDRFGCLMSGSLQSLSLGLFVAAGTADWTAEDWAVKSR